MQALPTTAYGSHMTVTHEVSVRSLINLERGTSHVQLFRRHTAGMTFLPSGSAAVCMPVPARTALDSSTVVARSWACPLHKSIRSKLWSVVHRLRFLSLASGDQCGS